MGNKPAYPYTKEQDERSNALMARLLQINKEKEAVTKELRQIIYSVEKPR